MRAFFARDQKVKTAILVVSVLALLAGLAVAGYTLLLNPEGSANSAGNLIVAPNLVGLDITQAREAAHKAGLKIAIDRWANDRSSPKNRVVLQRPEPNDQVKVDGIISVIVSSGSDSEGKDNAGPLDNAIQRDDLKPLPDPPLQPDTKKLGQLPPNRNPIKDKMVVIDPGHQEKADLEKEPVGPGSSTLKPKVTGGATGAKSRTPEYIITLKISQKLRDKLAAQGIRVIMTREQNNVRVSNIERARIANAAQADLFIRIHNDGSTDPDKSGISTLYPAQNQWTAPIYEDSLRAAQIVHKELVEATQRTDGGLVPRSDITGFNWSKVPVILVEAGFLSNPEEDTLLNSASYQDKLAVAMADGIIEYLGGQ